MTIYISDSFTGLEEFASPSGRALDNALGGATSAMWESGSGFYGVANQLGFTNSAATAAVNLPGLTGLLKARVKFDPGAGSANQIIVFAQSDITGRLDGVSTALFGGYTSLRVSSHTANDRTDHAQLTITKPTGVFWVEVEIDGGTNTVTSRILNEDTSVRNQVSHVFGTVPSGGTYWGFRGYSGNIEGTFDDFIVESSAAVDTTPPTLTLPTVTATGTTTVTGGITTNDAGPAWAILSTSATKPTAAQIKAGQSHLGVASPAATATLVVGANAGVFAFSGLAPTTGYFLHVVQDDTTVPANTSTVATSATVTTDTPLYPIITLPVLKNNTGTLLTSVTGATVHVYATATGNKVVTKTGQTSNASAVMAITDPALVAGTEYRCVIVLASGAEGLQKATAA